MSLYWELTKIDLLALKDWFTKQTFTKLIILVAYIVVMVGVGLGVYFWSKAFFQYIVEYENYGRLTALYVLRASFLILIWLGTLSSLISTVTFLLGNDKHFDLLLTFPISPLTLSLHSAAKSTLFTLFLLLISIFPLTLAYTGNLPGTIIALLLVLVITESIGSSLGYLTSLLLRKKDGWLWGIGTGLMILISTWFLLRLTFPRELQLLPDIPIEEFAPLFGNLPLIKNYWLTGGFADVSAGRYAESLPLFGVAILLFVFFIFIQKNLLISCRQAQKLHTSSMLRLKSGYGKPHRLNLITKDILSIVRSPKDLGYLVFLLSMVVVFFGLFTRGYLSRGIPARFQNDALAFAFGWLIFFSGTYLLRLTFPLMVNEGQQRWWLFTKPLSASRLIFSKVATSALISTPLIILAVLEWWLLPFTTNLGFFWILSLIAILSLAAVVPTLGAHRPDFSLAYQPDKASTTLAGLMAIVYVFILGAGGTYLISQALKGQITLGLAINGYLTFGLVTAFLSWFWAHKFIHQYTIDV